MTAAEPFLRLVEPNPERERRELGPNQLAWLRKYNIPFRNANLDAVRAIRHAERVKRRTQS
jgi:hypothetical protein